MTSSSNNRSTLYQQPPLAMRQQQLLPMNLPATRQPPAQLPLIQSSFAPPTRQTMTSQATSQAPLTRQTMTSQAPPTRQTMTSQAAPQMRPQATSQMSLPTSGRQTAPARQVPSMPMRQMPQGMTAAIPGQGTAMVQQNSSVVILNRMGREEEERWVRDLQDYLYEKILVLAEPDEQRRRKLLSPEAMKIWIPAFTHESYDPNVGNNYEELERLGDVIMAALFIYYLKESFAGITRSQLSELKNRYLSKAEQAPIGQKLGLQNWVRTPLDRNTHMFEDLLESLFGALLEIGDMTFTTGAGYVLCYNLLVNIYADIDIDLSYIKGHAKTQVKEIFEKLHWGEVIESWQSSEGEGSMMGGTLTLSFPPVALENLAQRQMQVPSKILASTDGPTKKVATDIVYPLALRRLSELGITRQWADLQRGQTEFTHPDFAPYYNDARNKLARVGLSDMYFKVPRIGTKGIYVQLIGIYPNGKLEVLSTAVGTNLLDTKRETLRAFATS